MEGSFLGRLNQLVWNFRSQFSAIPEYDFDSQGEIAHNFAPIKWTSSALIGLAISTIAGALIGVLVAMAVNSALVEISVSSSFALYFGVVFVFVGLVIVWRTIAIGRLPHPDESPAARVPRRYLIGFACLSRWLSLDGLGLGGLSLGGLSLGVSLVSVSVLVQNVLAGILCFTFDNESLLSMRSPLRVLTYSVLGMSTSFALTFGVVDILNLAIGACRSEGARPLVESILQIYVVVTTACCMGALFGCLFGINDISVGKPISGGFEGVTLIQVIDPMLCLPIGIACGGLAGLATEYIRKLEAAFNKLDQPVEFEYDI